MEQTALFMVIGGLLILTLVLASIAQRYRDFVEERRLYVQRILRRVAEIEGLVRRMAGLPVPVDAERLLRRDIVARLQVVKRIHSRYKGIDRMIQDAGTALSQVRATPRTTLDYLRLEQLSRVLGELLWLLRERRLIAPLTEDQRTQLMAVVTLQRAEYLYRHHIREAERLAEEDQLHQAHWHCVQMQKLLKPLAGTHQQVGAWYQEAQPLCERITARLRGAQVDDSPSE